MISAIFIVCFASSSAIRRAKYTAPPTPSTLHHHPCTLISHAPCPNTPSPAPIRCGTLDLHSAALRTRTNYTVTLTLHAEDDHSKNMHGCLTQYSFSVTRPNGTHLDTPPNFGNDDAWARTLSFRIEGSAPSSNQVFAITLEGGRPPAFQVLTLDPASGETDAFTAPNTFTRALSPACFNTLEVAGLTPAGEIVFHTQAAAACKLPHTWQFTTGKSPDGANRVKLLPANLRVAPLQTN